MKVIVIGQPTTEAQKAILILKDIEVVQLEGLTDEDIKNLSNVPQSEIREAYAEAINNFKDRHPDITIMPKIEKPLVYSSKHKKGRKGRKGNRTEKYF